MKYIMKTKMKQGIVILFLLFSFCHLSAQDFPKLSSYMDQCPLLVKEDRIKLSDSLRSMEMIQGRLSVANYTPNEVFSLSVTLLPMVNGTPLIGVIETYRRPRLDSQVRFFTSDWTEIETAQILSRPLQKENFLSSIDALQVYSSYELYPLLHPLYTEMWWSEDGRKLVVECRPVLGLENKKTSSLVYLVQKLPRVEYVWYNGRLEAQ